MKILTFVVVAFIVCALAAITVGIYVAVGTSRVGGTAGIRLSEYQLFVFEFFTNATRLIE